MIAYLRHRHTEAGYLLSIERADAVGAWNLEQRQIKAANAKGRRRAELDPEMADLFERA